VTDVLELGKRGTKLTIDQLVRVARDPSVKVTRAREADATIEVSAKKIADLVERHREARASNNVAAMPREYGITTGFGEFKDKLIEPEDLQALQKNLILSHSVGVGENVIEDDLSNYYSAEVIRGALLIRLNTFLHGHSGVRLLLVDVVQAMLNGGVVPLVPLRGSVGASGDLCPLSHLFATLYGQGRFYQVHSPEDLKNATPVVWNARRKDSDDAARVPDVLQIINGVLRPIREERSLPELTWNDLQLRPKEGLALNNGAAFSAAMLALGVHDAQVLANTADVALAMTLEAIAGCTRAFDPKVHEARPHEGQIYSAKRVRELLVGSTFVERAKAVQDPYSVRCGPQVHGASRDAINYVERIAATEINAATDNPLFFDGKPWDEEQYPDRGLPRMSYSAGNFHGQPVALAADFLTIALAELANISERRVQMLLDGNHNRTLPPNLTAHPGLNSGFMIAQYTAASLVSENKVLAHPASVDSIPTSANSEDHVSMSTHAARKMRTVLGNVQSVIAIELLAAAQALDWRACGAPPKLPDDKEERRTAQEKWQPSDPDAARALTKEFGVFLEAEATNVSHQLAEGIREPYARIRTEVPAMLEDRMLDGDVRSIRRLIAANKLSGVR